MRVVLALAALLAITSVARAEPPDVEAVFAVKVTAQALTITVATNGCARKSDFTVAVLKQKPQALLLIARKHPETCSGSPGQAALTYSLAELGLAPGEPFVLANPLIAGPGQ